MKAGWEEVALGEVCELFTDGDWIETKDQSSAGIRLVQTGNVGPGFFKDRRDKARWIDEETFERLNCTEIQENDVLVSRLPDPVGRACIIPDTGDRMITAVDCTIIRFKEPIIEPAFFLYYSQSEPYLRDIEKLCTGTTRKRISRKNLGKIAIPLPPLEEQKRIVAVLDAAFAKLDRARANVEANLEDAETLFLSCLRDVFANTSNKWQSSEGKSKSLLSDPSAHNAKGRAATLRPIPGDYSLSVLQSAEEARRGWRWSRLTDLARLESGHTPSRRKPDYWGGDVPWMGIKDARANHGQSIKKTLENTNEVGLANSSARLLPKHTVCLSRTASVGYVVKTEVELATSQDFVNWVCGPDLSPDFLRFLLLAQDDELHKFSSGAVHKTIYFPEVKAFTIAHPDLAVQREIARDLEVKQRRSDEICKRFRAQLLELDSLRQSILQRAFAGELNTSSSVDVSVDQSYAELSAAVLVYAFDKHLTEGSQNTFGRVKGQKILSLAEQVGRMELGRSPTKQAAGPHDEHHMKRMEQWATEQEIFRFKPRDGGSAYTFVRGRNYDKFLKRARSLLGENRNALDRFLPLIVKRRSRYAEVLATVHAAWGNLLADGHTPDDDEIVRAAREEWHSRKLKIPKEKFNEAIRLIRREGIEPDGTAKYVGGQGELSL